MRCDPYGCVDGDIFPVVVCVAERANCDFAGKKFSVPDGGRITMVCTRTERYDNR